MRKWRLATLILAASFLVTAWGAESKQVPATPDAPAACLQAVKNYAAERGKVSRDKVTLEYFRETAQGRIKIARDCAAHLSIATTPAKDLAVLAELYTEAQQSELANEAIAKSLSSPALDPGERAQALGTAVNLLLRQPISPARNAKAEEYVAELDKLPEVFLRQKLEAHARLNGYYRGDDIDAGIIRHSTWLIETARGLTPEERREFAFPLVSAYTSLAEAYAGQEQNGKALDLLRRAPKELAGIEDVEGKVRPTLERYLLVGKPAAAIEAPRWLNAPAGTTSFEPKGGVTLVEFTAHWCGPCRESYPGIHRLEKRFGSRGLRVVLVTELYGFFGNRQNLPADQEFEADRGYFVTEYGFTCPIAVGDAADITRSEGRIDRKVNAVNTNYKVEGIPQIHIIDKRGIHRLIMIGYDEANEERLASLIERLLAEAE